MKRLILTVLSLANIQFAHAEDYVCYHAGVVAENGVEVDYNAGPSLFWKNRMVILNPGSNDPLLLEAIQTAVDVWNQADCSDLEFLVGGVVDPSMVPLFNANDFSMTKANNIVSYDNTLPSSLIGHASVTRWFGDGEILEIRIRLNSADYEFANCEKGCKSTSGKPVYDLATVIIHELGHGLGLAHNNVPGSVMYPHAKPKKTNRDLWQVDYEGICALYPLNSIESPNCYPEYPRGEVRPVGVHSEISGGCNQSNDRSSGTFFLFAFVIFGLYYFRSRRK